MKDKEYYIVQERWRDGWLNNLATVSHTRAEAQRIFIQAGGRIGDKEAPARVVRCRIEIEDPGVKG